MKAKEMYNQLTQIVKELETNKETLNEQLRECDLEQSDLLHCIEIGRCDAVTLVKISVQLKAVRTRRREIKNELEQLQTVSRILASRKQSVIDTKFKDPSNKKYTYRTDALLNITNHHKGQSI